MRGACWVVALCGCGPGVPVGGRFDLSGAPDFARTSDFATGELDLALSSGDGGTPDLAADGGGGLCPKPVLNEVQTSGGGGADDEFIEIASRCRSVRSLDGWKLVYRSATGMADVDLVGFAGVMIPANGHLVCAQTGYLGPADVRYGGSIAQAGGGLALRDSVGQQIDAVGWGSAVNAFVEQAAAPSPAVGMSIARTPDGHDTNDNAADFAVAAPTPGAVN